MKFGLQMPNLGGFADVNLLIDAAQMAEDCGWDGIYLWDHVGIPDKMVDPMTVFGAIAAKTERIRFGPMITSLSRRRPWKLAREATTLDLLSNGRFTLGVGMGASNWDFERVGDVGDNKIKADRTDEALEIMDKLWRGETVHHDGTHYHVNGLNFRPRPIQQPRIPVWCAAGYPHKKPLRRAAQWDGVFPLAFDDRFLTPDEWREILAYIRQHRTASSPFDAAHNGITQDADDIDTIKPYADAGVTWWMEEISPIRLGWKLSQSTHWGDDWDTDAILSRISKGIPSSDDVS
jgi:alkanesulfonate monooxygenase SsuD/methylene tetrahydromethanopterin reductase-like flavin-dependent oxidoreductase (luciferase family)